MEKRDQKVVLLIISFVRELLATFLFYYLRNKLNQEVYYANALTSFAISVIMRLPFRNTWTFILHLATRRRFHRESTNSFLDKDSKDNNLGVKEIIWLLFTYTTAEVAGVACAASASVSSDFYFGQVVSATSKGLSWKICPSEWGVPSILQDKAAARNACFVRNNRSIEQCYNIHQDGPSYVSSTDENIYKCVYPDPYGLYAWWVADDLLATFLCLILAMHIWHMKQEQTAPEDETQTLFARNTKTMQKIWKAAAYMSLAGFCIDLMFPFAAYNPMTCLYEILVILLRGKEATRRMEEFGFRMLGGAIGALVAYGYYFMVYECENNEVLYMIAWNSVRPVIEVKQVTKEINNIPSQYHDLKFSKALVAKLV
jgi:hypothetical protein